MSVNKVILVGNVGKDPEVKYLERDVAVANFPLATTERGYKTANGTEVPERTEWHNVVCWRGLATVVEKYVKKGSQLYIEGKIRTRSYEQDGIKRYVTEIYADELQMMGKKENTGNGTGNETPRAVSESKPSGANQTAPANSGSSEDNNPDDLPF
jgi:single-strand DNA-binding protein